MTHERRAFAIALALSTVVTVMLVWPAAADVHPPRPDTRPLANWAQADELPAPPAADIAIDAAIAKIGTPYRWAGTGSNGFDCSGLTQYAYARAGISLPHNSGAQRAATEHVPLDEIEPGDLVFSGWGGIGHVGLYIGDGKMVHAPQSGGHVEIAPLRRNLISAGRPG